MRTFFIYLFLEYKKSAKVLLKSTVSLLLAAVLLLGWLRPAIGRLAREVAPVPVVFYDERFTSALAHKAMLDGGLKRMARRDKALVDEISAAIILNDFLQSRQHNQQ